MGQRGYVGCYSNMKSTCLYIGAKYLGEHKVVQPKLHVVPYVIGSNLYFTSIQTFLLS